MALYHVTLAARRHGPLFPTEEHQRKAVRELARAANGQLSLFNTMDQHGHATVAEVPTRLARTKHRFKAALNVASTEPIAVTWEERVEDPKHAASLVRYHVTQTVHHKTGVHPVLQSGSCAHELLGTRWIPGLALRTELVGKPSEPTILRHLGLSPRPLLPVTDETIRVLGACRLRAAASAALAASPRLTGKSAPVVLARRVAVQMGVAAGLSRADLAHALEVHPRSLRYMLRNEVPAEASAAVRLRLALEQAVAAATGCTFRLGRG